jgi:S-adenosylmethionine-dependent methyltransferase
VLEWLADPQEDVEHHARFLRPEGRLWLMFYNRNAALLKRALEGDFALALDEGVPRRRGWVERATSLAEDLVREWLDHWGLRVRSKAGTRFLDDHVPEDLRRPERIGELLKAEKRLSSKGPFASLAQHAHLVCERSEV